MHRVKRELRRLLVGATLAALAVVVSYFALDSHSRTLRRAQEQFHDPALALAAELSGALGSMTLPPGVSTKAIDQLDDEVAFVSSVTRDYARARALLESLIALHRQAADPTFARAEQRLERAREQLASLAQRFQGDPLGLARIVSLQPLYATIAVEQTRRLHEAAVRGVMAQQATARLVFAGGFVLVSALLGLAFSYQLRRSLRGIDGILALERHARERAAAVLAAVPDLWFTLDRDGRFVEVSGAGHPDLDRGWDTLHGQPFRRVPAPLDPAAEAADADAPLHARTFEYRVAGDADGPRTYEGRLVPTSDGQWLYLSRDISERKRAELALARSNEELEQQVASRTAQLTIARDAAETANRAKSDFLSRMSHELRTPMNAVLGFAQLLSLEQALEQRHRQALDHILRAGKHLLHLINDVLDLAHVESGHITLSPEPLRVADIVEEVMTLLRPLAKVQRIRLEVGALAGAVVRGDRLRLKQVLLNLASNAVKYNRPDGWVRIDSSAGSDGRLRIVVEDSGQGIAAGDQARLFEPFSRLGQELGAIEGTGIGLSISKRLIELMDGRIGVDSEVGRGSRFWIELPGDQLAAQPAEASGWQDTASGPGAQHSCVLYVEDNPDNLALVARIVERHPGVQLISAPSASLGFDLARSHRPDLILLDIHLPDLDGYGLLERLRAHAETRSIAVVAVTANAMPHDEARALGAGFAAYVTKPIDVPKFDVLLRRMLRQAPER